jgi:hypothetical protein
MKRIKINKKEEKNSGNNPRKKKKKSSFNIFSLEKRQAK